MSQSVYNNWENTLSDEEEFPFFDDIATQPPLTQAPVSRGSDSESEEDEEEDVPQFLDASDNEYTESPATQDPGRGRYHVEEDEEEYNPPPNYPAHYECLEAYITDREKKMRGDPEESHLPEESLPAQPADMEMEEGVESVKNESEDYHTASVFEEHSALQDNNSDEDDIRIASQYDNDEDATQGDDVDMLPPQDPGFYFQGVEISIEEIETSDLFYAENGQPTFTMTLEKYARGCRQDALRLAKYWYDAGYRCINKRWVHCIFSPEELQKARETKRRERERRRELKRMYCGTYPLLISQGLTEDEAVAKLEEIEAEAKAWDARYKRKRDEEEEEEEAEEEAALGSRMKRLRIEEPVASSSRVSNQRPRRALGKVRRHRAQI
ncbi:hypothetical protein CYLTODRAFT_456338 [Cylindrobasidium torrendii FP15055 ss-10]|uniref:Uncharacterized protein n=1 Tax=Cylindrobasidium torrendii FP15055 ss-10 TaxID=1314674 RepID=A0A0D7B4K2_9AGAR|nr:hypothetical protein CYLTODRAFT_456338 [Cylindrobasidium torrendii FP15055 ss-10]